MTAHSSKAAVRNRFRIIAGQWRGRKLSFPGDVESLRPTPDRIRETLFNWLQDPVRGARCLDLFAGSGALAFESLSRGAAAVTVVDETAGVTGNITTNCRILGCSNMDIVTANALHWLQAQAGKRQFDIIFLDPPYREELLPRCLELLGAGDFLADGGVVYLESDRDLESLPLPANWELLKAKKAGGVFYGLCRKG